MGGFLLGLIIGIVLALCGMVIGVIPVKRKESAR